MDGELVAIDLGEHRVEVHEGTGHRDVEGQDGVDRARLVVEDVASDGVDGVGLGALGDADGQHVLVDVQDVAALDVEGHVAMVVLGRAGEVRMVLEDVVAVDGLAVARHRVHAVDGHAVADHRERVAGEVQVRHGGADQLAAVGHHVHQQVGVLLGQLLQVDAGHGLHDHVLGARVVGVDVVLDDLLVGVGADAGLEDPLVEELLAKLRMGVQHLGHEVLQVHYLDTLVAKDLREGVVLLLGHRQKRDVVEQQLFQGVRGEVQQLVAGAVKNDLLEVADLAFDVYSLHRSSPILDRIQIETRQPHKTSRGFESFASPSRIKARCV